MPEENQNEKAITPQVVEQPEERQEKALQKSMPIHPTGPVTGQDDVIIPDAHNLYLLARGFARSRMFPGITNEYEALAVLELGRELGIKPAVALQTITPIRGRLCVEAKVYQALLEKNENKITVLEKTREKCRIQFEREGKDPYTEEFTFEDAKRMGLSEKDNWAKNPGPAMMNFYRCISNGGRVYDPGAILGLYTKEEMQDAGPFRAAKKRDDEDEAKRKAKAKKEADEKAKEQKPKEEKPVEEKPKRPRGRPKGSTKKKKEKPPEPEKPKEEPASPPEEKPEVKEAKPVPPQEGDPSQMTEEEMVEHYREKIQEQIKLRTRSEKEFRDEYKSLKDFLYNFQIEKQKNEDKDYHFVEFNKYNHLSLAEGRGKDLKMVWDNFQFILTSWIEWEKKQKERKEMEDEEGDLFEGEEPPFPEEEPGT